MKAKQVLLVAMGSKKAEAVKELLQGEYSEECPLQFYNVIRM